MSNQYNEALYEQLHDECYFYMMDELMLKYQSVLLTLEGEESSIFAEWLDERASKFADERAPELYNERGE
jgi:hypothetical protein